LRARQEVGVEESILSSRKALLSMTAKGGWEGQEAVIVTIKSMVATHE